MLKTLERFLWPSFTNILDLSSVKRFVFMVTCIECKEWAMLHYVFMPPHEKRFCAPLCPPARIICPKTLRSDQCAASANPCTPCAECSSCIALSWCQHVAGYQLSAKAIAIAVVALVFVCFWLSTFGWSFRQRTSKKPVTVFVRPTSARSRGLCKAFHGLSTERY